MTVPLVMWDGSYLGDLDKFITSSVNEFDLVRITFRGLYYGSEKNLKAQVYKYSDNVPLIIDELKMVFGMAKVGRHVATIEGKHYLLCQDGLECQLSEYKELLPIDKELKHSIARCYVFRWIMGLTLNTDSSIRMRINKFGTYAHSYREVGIKYTTSKITSIAVKSWFVDECEVEQIVKEFVNNRPHIEIRMNIESIIRRIDPEYVWMISYILDRIVF